MPPAPARSYVLPDLRSLCPWKGSFNPHYGDSLLSASQWALQHASAAIAGKDGMLFFEQRSGELLAAWSWPYADREKLRGCCDFINFTYVVDEISDRQGGKDAHATTTTALNAMKDDAFDDGTVLCAMIQDFKTRVFPHMGPISRRRFVHEVERYLVAVAREAQLRERSTVLDLASYDQIRRRNSGVPCCFELFGYLFGVDLPDEVYDHPVLQEMYFAAVDMVSWANDVYSYKVEVLKGLPENNVVTVLQQEMVMSLQDAADYVGAHFKELVDTYESGKADMPSFGDELDKVVQQYCTMMECWVIGNIEWSFATKRYFGEEGAKVKDTLIVELSP